MKRLFLFLILTCLMFGQQTGILLGQSANDPWQPYEYGNKFHPAPAVPEPATYGFVMVGSSAALAMYLRRKRREKNQKSS